MPRKGESIFKRNDGRWEGRYIKERTMYGDAVYGYIYGKSYTDVKERMIKKISEPNQPLRRKRYRYDPTKPPIGILAEDWLMIKQPQVKVSTYMKYRNLVYSYIVKRIGTVTVDQIDAAFLNDYCNTLLEEGGANEQGLSNKTVGDTMSVMRSILRYAQAQRIDVGCTGKEVMIRTDNKKMRILTKREQRKLENYISHDMSYRNVGILLCLYTGMRIGEICALRWEDVSFREKTIHVHSTMQRLQTGSDLFKKTRVMVTTPKSSCSIRTIPIPPALLEILAEESQKYGFVLTGDHSFVEPRTMENHFKSILKRAELETVNFHCLRHTFATRCVEAGVDIKTLSEILGHATVSITMNRYVHPTMKMKRDSMARLAEMCLVGM